jgi:hypothetical protein
MKVRRLTPPVAAPPVNGGTGPVNGDASATEQAPPSARNQFMTRNEANFAKRGALPSRPAFVPKPFDVLSALVKSCVVTN